jgi:hypothetical protein
MGILRCLRKAYSRDRDIEVLDGPPIHTVSCFCSISENARWLEIETGLLLCGLAGTVRRMWTLVEELQSGDPRMRSNALEVVDYFLPRQRGQLWVPLEDPSQQEQKRKVAKEVLQEGA